MGGLAGITLGRMAARQCAHAALMSGVQREAQAGPARRVLAHWHLRKLSNAAGKQVPLAHVVPDVQKAPLGARQLPPVQAVPIGQSAAVEQVAQLPLTQA